MRVLDTVPFICSLVIRAGRIRPARRPYLSMKKQLPAAVEVVIDQGSKVTAYGGGRIVKRGQEVSADIPNLCRVLPQAAYHILDIRTRQADLRNIEALRAKGYKKGAKKGYVGNIQLLHRTTDPQTVYVKSKLDRDDIIDIQDFDVVQYLYGIDRMNLNEELATAIMIGDGREVGADGKIAEDKIRPIWLDDELYTMPRLSSISEEPSTMCLRNSR